MNLIVIGHNTDDVAMDMWKGNTNYCVLNRCPSIFNDIFLKYINLRKVIVSVSPEQFENVNPNKFIDFLFHYKFIPLFVANEDEDKDSIVYKMYYTVNELFENTMLFKRNKENKDYTEFIDTAKGYLNGKGIVENDYQSIRTPRKRKTSTTKK